MGLFLLRNHVFCLLANWLVFTVVNSIALSIGKLLFKTPLGIKALSIEGDELWNTKHDSFFELSPLIHLQRDNSSVCNNGELDEIGWPDLIITGWTNGQVSAHRLIDGELQWSWNSEVIKNGITGRINTFKIC